MDFNANQMRQDALIPDGKYKFRVRDAREKRSQAGNDMLNLKLTLLVNGREVQYWDSLILMPKMFWKFEHFCETAGLKDKLEAGRIMAQDCLNREGWIEITQKVDSQTGVLANQTKDYCLEPQELLPIADSDPTSLDDDIPNFS